MIRLSRCLKGGFMNSYFLTRLSSEQKKKLDEKSIAYFEFALGDENGLLLQADAMESALEVLELIAEEQVATNYEGIFRTRVRATHSELASAANVGSWKGKNKHGMLQIVQQLFLPYLQKQIVLENRHGVVAPINDGNFHIHIYSAPVKTSGCNTPKTIWGIPTQSSSNSWSPSGKGTCFYDGKYAVAELLEQNNLYVFHNLAESGNVNEEMLFSVLLDRVLQHLQPEQSEAQAKHLFIDACSYFRCAGLTEASGSADELQVSIRELKKELKKCSRAAAAEELKLLRNEKISTDEIFAAEYENLLKVPKVTDVQVENGVIIVSTEVLYAKDPRSDKYHEIGAFKIHLSPENESPRWFNQTRLVKSIGTKPMQAVHVFNSGMACLGNTEALFKDLFKQREWALAAQVAIEFAESVNQRQRDNAGLHVTEWPEAADADVARRDKRISRPKKLTDAQLAYKQQYISACADRVNSLIKDSLCQIESIRRTVEELQAELVSLLRNRASKLKQATRKKLCNRDEIAAEFDALLRVPKVTGVRVQDRSVTISTETLFCTCPNSKLKREIGSFLIKINLDGSGDCVRWINTSRQVKACYQKQNAVRVLSSGRALFSDIRESFPDLIADFKLAILAQLAIEFIEQIDADEPASTFLDQWPESQTSGAI